MRLKEYIITCLSNLHGINTDCVYFEITLDAYGAPDVNGRNKISFTVVLKEDTPHD